MWVWCLVQVLVSSWNIEHWSISIKSAYSFSNSSWFHKMSKNHLYLACGIISPWQIDKETMHNGLTNEITFTHNEKNFILNPLSHSQGVKDQVQMKQKRDEEKKIIIILEKKKALGSQRCGRIMFLPTRSFNKKKELKTHLKICFLLNNLQAF